MSGRGDVFEPVAIAALPELLRRFPRRYRHRWPTDVPAQQLIDDVNCGETDTLISRAALTAYNDMQCEDPKARSAAMRAVVAMEGQNQKDSHVKKASKRQSNGDGGTVLYLPDNGRTVRVPNE